MLSGSGDKPMIGCLNKSYLEGEESMVKGVIGKESTVTHINWEKVIFGTYVASTITLCYRQSLPPPSKS